jgi:threonine synthase
VTVASLRCRVCERTHPLAPLTACPVCSEPLDVDYDSQLADALEPTPAKRYRLLLPLAAGDPAAADPTPLSPAPRLSAALGVDLLLKLENANPTGSFKDRIATTAAAAAREFGFETVCCASTGNLAEAVAVRCAEAGLEAVVLCPTDHLPRLDGAHGARVFAVDGTFDDCRMLERQLEAFFPWGFVGGNLHALAAEGVKPIAYEVYEQLGGELPDAVVAPVGSGTLFAKLAQGFDEVVAHGPGGRLRPRLYGGQAEGCPPLAAAWADDRPPSRVRPATAVRSLAVGDPPYGDLAVGAARMSGGAILAVPEDEIAARAEFLTELTGVFADPAAGVAVGVLLDLVRSGEVRQGERVVLVVTGGSHRPSTREVDSQTAGIDSDVDALLAALGVS